MMHRRDVLAGGIGAAAVLGLGRPAVAQQGRVLRFVPYTDLAIFDPVFTTVDITRDYGYMVYDTLYGLDEHLQPRPQLAEGHRVEQDGRLWTVTLRSGLRFHDGEAIRAQDCVASLKRWMAVAPMGQTLAARMDEMAALDDRRIRFRLKSPFPLLLNVLGQATAPVPFIMPERVAQAPATQQITDTTGSGPFVFKRDEYQLGVRAVYERFAGYSPTPDGGRGLTAGAKQVHFDRVEWRRIPDASTAAAALQTGEVDWYAEPPAEIIELFDRARDIEVSRLELLPSVMVLRPNHLHPPFDNKKLRQALLPALSQEDYAMAAVGTDPKRFAVGTGFFPAGSSMASDAGLAPLLGPRDLNKARQLIKEAGYGGEKVRLLGNAEGGVTGTMAQVTADLMPRLGFNFEAALLDSASVTQRRRSMEPVENGGWSLSCWAFPGLWFENPGTHSLIRGNGKDAWFGWPTAPRIEALRDEWLVAPTLEQQQRLAREMQVVAMDELPSIPLGCLYRLTAMKKALRGRVPGFPIFWNLRRDV
ncbi:Tat pathway signal sequence domain protein [Acetobacteraceae bacterium AT-5844]|nr:Tat pathway signal sequence domain protein [Acetobacteraceae bacterium AT-5844]